MQQLTTVLDPDAAAGRKAPAFTQHDHDTIAGWSEAIKGQGLRIETHTDLYNFLEEVLLVTPRSPAEPTWLIHRTPAGAVAVRMWPGLAEIVATVPEALAIVTAAVEQAGADTV